MRRWPGLGVDISTKMVELPVRPPRAMLHFQTASADALPRADASVSHILNIESIYHTDPEAALYEGAGGRRARDSQWCGSLRNPATHVWIDVLDIAVHLLSAPRRSRWPSLRGGPMCAQSRSSTRALRSQRPSSR